MSTTIYRTKGDTRKPIAVRLTTAAGDPEELSALSVKFKMVSELGTVIVAATTSNVTNQPTQAFTATAGTDRITTTGHGVQEGLQLILASSGTLPAGLSPATRYYATQVTPNDMKLALTPGGVPVDITGTGTGSHSFYVVGHTQYDFQPADVATAGSYWAWFQIVDGSETDTFPANGRDFRIEIVEAA